MAITHAAGPGSTQAIVGSQRDNEPVVNMPASPQPWTPPDIDLVPATRSEPCPLPEILEGGAQRMQELVLNLQRFSATETLQATELLKNGTTKPAKSLNVSYVAEFRDVGGRPSLDEYRNDSPAFLFYPTNSPTKLASIGTVLSALIFHPSYVHDFAMDCEGMSDVNGVSAWQIHFVQLPGTNGFRFYYVEGAWHPVRLKGRAWISAKTYQVLRIEHDLVQPIPKIRLLRDYVAVEYRLVDFPRHSVQIWLPESSTICTDFRGHRYLLRHRFSDFKLFWVETQQEVKLPE